MPGPPSVPAADENTTTGTEPATAARFSTASTFGRNTRATSCGVIAVSTASASTAAVCTTVLSGRSGGSESNTRASAARSATSQAATVTSAPSSVMAAAIPALPSACDPRRLTKSRCRTP